jgi:hypothetical protein
MRAASTGKAKIEAAAKKATEARAEASAAEKKADEALAALQAKPDDAALHKTLQDQQLDLRNKEQAAAAAETKAASARSSLAGYLQWTVDEARKREDKALGIRKFKSGEIDAAKANVDIAIRDNLPAAELKSREDRVAALVGDMAHPEQDGDAGKDTFAALNEIYQTISASRRDLERTVKQINANAEAAQKAHDESVAELERLRKQKDEREERYLFTNRYPWIFGKKLLTLPILDALVRADRKSVERGPHKTTISVASAGSTVARLAISGQNDARQPTTQHVHQESRHIVVPPKIHRQSRDTTTKAKRCR